MGRILSIEINGEEIKIIEGEKKDNMVTIFNFASLKLTEKVYDGKILKINLVEKSIRELLTEKQIKTKKALFIINGNFIINRNIILPILNNAKETKSMLYYSLRQTLAVNVDEYNISYKIGKVYIENGVERARYIIYCIPKNICRQYEDLSYRLKFELKLIQISSNFLEKIYVNELAVNNIFFHDETIAFIDIGTCSLNFSIVSKGITEFSKVFDLSYKIKNNSESYKICGCEKTTHKADIWMEEINKCIRYYYSLDKNIYIDKIFIFGSECLKINIPEYTSSYLNIDTEYVHDLSKIAVADKSDNRLNINKYFCSILSLFVEKNDLNFINEKKINFKFQNLLCIKMFVLLLIIGFVCVFFVSNVYIKSKEAKSKMEIMSSFLNNEENIRINKEIESIKKNIENLQEYKANVIKLKDKIAGDKSISAGLLLKVIKEFGVGNDVKSILISKDNVQFQCTSNSLAGISELVKDFKKIKEFDNVYIPEVENDKNYESKYNYIIICNLRKSRNYEKKN